MRKLIVCIAILLGVVLLSFWGIPAFAQTYAATKISNPLLSKIAAEQIITNSELPIEKLPDGTTNNITRGRDAVNAYRYAHGQLSKNGWYRGISEDHTPLLVAMVNVLEKEGYTSSYLSIQYKAPEVLRKFWYASDTQNANELGYDSLEKMQTALTNMVKSGKIIDANLLRIAIDNKWK